MCDSLSFVNGLQTYGFFSFPTTFAADFRSPNTTPYFPRPNTDLPFFHVFLQVFQENGGGMDILIIFAALLAERERHYEVNQAIASPIPSHGKPDRQTEQTSKEKRINIHKTMPTAARKRHSSQMTEKQYVDERVSRRPRLSHSCPTTESPVSHDWLSRQRRVSNPSKTTLSVPV